MKRPIDIAKVSDEILSQVAHVESVKTAEAEAIRAATPRHQSEIAQALHKVAEDLRATPPDVTYQDLDDYLRGCA